MFLNDASDPYEYGDAYGYDYDDGWFPYNGVVYWLNPLHWDWDNYAEISYYAILDEIDAAWDEHDYPEDSLHYDCSYWGMSEFDFTDLFKWDATEPEEPYLGAPIARRPGADRHELARKRFRARRRRAERSARPNAPGSFCLVGLCLGGLCPGGLCHICHKESLKHKADRLLEAGRLALTEGWNDYADGIYLVDEDVQNGARP